MSTVSSRSSSSSSSNVDELPGGRVGHSKEQILDEFFPWEWKQNENFHVGKSQKTFWLNPSFELKWTNLFCAEMFNKSQFIDSVVVSSWIKAQQVWMYSSCCGVSIHSKHVFVIKLFQTVSNCFTPNCTPLLSEGGQNLRWAAVGRKLSTTYTVTGGHIAVKHVWVELDYTRKVWWDRLRMKSKRTWSKPVDTKTVGQDHSYHTKTHTLKITVSKDETQRITRAYRSIFFK